MTQGGSLSPYFGMVADPLKMLYITVPFIHDLAAALTGSRFCLVVVVVGLAAAVEFQALSIGSGLKYMIIISMFVVHLSVILSVC